MSYIETEIWEIKESCGFPGITTFAGPSFSYAERSRIERGHEFTVYEKQQAWINQNDGTQALTTWLKTDCGWVSEVSRMTGNIIAKYKRTNASVNELQQQTKAKENKKQAEEDYQNEMLTIHCCGSGCNDSVQVKRKNYDSSRYICYICKCKYG